MRILFLSFHYPPDLSACSFRSQALVQALLSRPAADPKSPLQLDVLTTCPHRYASFASRAPEQEHGENWRIRRIELPPHGSGLLAQARAALRYFRQAQQLARREHYDLVIATSSRIMTAVLGARIARRQQAPLYLDIRDVFAQNLPELFPHALRRPLRWLLERLEAYPLNSACRVNLNSAGFAEHFVQRYPRQVFSFHTNGVDELFRLPPAVASTPPADGQVLQVVYAGNIGAGQALHRIIPALAARLGSAVHFRLYGDGGRLKALREALQRDSLSNVELHAPVPREQLPAIYQSADVLFLHLADWRSCEQVLPSKLFEYIASGKPLWAGASGWTRRFIADQAGQAALFAPGDCQGAVASLRSLALHRRDVSRFTATFDRRTIMQRMAGDILGVVKPGPVREWARSK